MFAGGGRGRGEGVIRSEEKGGAGGGEGVTRAGGKGGGKGDITAGFKERGGKSAEKEGGETDEQKMEKEELKKLIFYPLLQIIPRKMT